MGRSDRDGPGGAPWQQEEADVATDTDQVPVPPRRYKVLLLNDDYTTMEFVVQILVDVFHHEHDEAVEIMLNVHHRGVGVAGVYSREVAETKVARAIDLARQSEFPLRCTMEPE